MLNIANCIICGSDTDLDTDMTINIDGEKVVVKVCAKDSEEVTPKAAREAYLKRKTDIEAFLEQAKKLGLSVSASPASGITTLNGPPRSQQLSQPQYQEPQQPQAELHGSRADGFVSTSEADRALRRVGGASGVATGAAGSSAKLEGHRIYDPDALLTDKLPEGTRDGIVRLGIAEGRQGQPITIPAIRQDGTGTTTIRITQHVRDHQLQQRFKGLADRSRDDRDGGPDFRNEYELAACPMCRGETTVSVNQGGELTRVVCPKCGGSGLRGS